MERREKMGAMRDTNGGGEKRKGSPTIARRRGSFAKEGQAALKEKTTRKKEERKSRCEEKENRYLWTETRGGEKKVQASSPLAELIRSGSKVIQV